MLHGALIDAELLADVYVELTGGRQIGFDLSVSAAAEAEQMRAEWPQRTWEIPLADQQAHADFVGKMKEPLWLKQA